MELTLVLEKRQDVTTLQHFFPNAMRGHEKPPVTLLEAWKACSPTMFGKPFEELTDEQVGQLAHALAGFVVAQKLKKILFNNRQFVGLLLLLFAGASLAVSLTIALNPVDDSLDVMRARFQSEVGAADKFGFLLPPAQSLLLPFVVVTALLGVVYYALSTKTSRRSHT